MKEKIIILFCIFLLLQINFSSAANLTYNFSNEINLLFDESFSRQINYSCYNITTNNSDFYYRQENITVQINKSSLVRIDGAKLVYLNNKEFKDNESSFIIQLDNFNKSMSINLVNYTDDFVIVNFDSDFEYPENLLLNLFNKNFSIEVFHSQQIFIPFELDYSLLNKSNVRNKKINVTLFYNLTNLNNTGNITFLVGKTEKPEINLAKDLLAYKVNDIILERINIESKVPIVNVSIDSSDNITFRSTILNDEVLVYIEPNKTGIYNFNYTVTDFFGNQNTINSMIDVSSYGNYFFRDLTIPSLKMGEEMKILIFENDRSTSLQFTPSKLEFVPSNISIYNMLNKTIYTSVDIFLSDESGNNYYLKENKTSTTLRDKVYLNIKMIDPGTFKGNINILSADEIDTNDKFSISIKSGNVSIFEKQEINVNGIITTCELSDPLNLYNSNRRCWVDFPLTEESMSNNLIILTERDFNSYESSNRKDKELIKEHGENETRKQKDYKIIFIILFLFASSGWIYTAIPKDWVVLRKKKFF